MKFVKFMLFFFKIIRFISLTSSQLVSKPFCHKTVYITQLTTRVIIYNNNFAVQDITFQVTISSHRDAVALTECSSQLSSRKNWIRCTNQILKVYSTILVLQTSRSTVYQKLIHGQVEVISQSSITRLLRTATIIWLVAKMEHILMKLE